MSTFLPHMVEKAVLRLYEDLATPRSLAAAMLFRAGEWDQLATLEVDPRHYLEAMPYWRDAMATSLLRKLEDLPTTFDRKAKAIENFFLAEKECLRANRRFYPLTIGDTSFDGLPRGVLDILFKAQKIVTEILGPCPDLIDGKFGPGATFGDRGQLTTIPDKMSSQPTFTSDAWPFLIPWSGTLWASACASSGKDPQSVRGNRFTTVPKDCKKNRGIAVEPSINLFYQLGYGRVIRQRLNRHGINLTEGQDIHRRLAREASNEGHLATLDLSNASDTICRNLVKFLLPSRWFEVLDSLRSKRTQLNGRWYLLEKFSSMGNGFTFELESLIFLALTASICGEDKIGKQVFAFGDDLILPTQYSEAVVSLLSFCGFTTNKEKSFVSGVFRESCGGDFFGGTSVRPYFLKDSPNEPQQLIAFANGLKRAADGCFVRESFVYRAWRTILDGIPSEIRSLRGPQDLGDLVIHDSSDRWRTRWRRGIRYVRVYRPAEHRKVSWRNFRPDVVLAAATYGLSSGLPTGRPWSVHAGISPRDAVTGFKVGWVPYS